MLTKMKDNKNNVNLMSEFRKLDAADQRQTESNNEESSELTSKHGELLILLFCFTIYRSYRLIFTYVLEYIGMFHILFYTWY